MKGGREKPGEEAPVGVMPKGSSLLLWVSAAAWGAWLTFLGWMAWMRLGGK